MSKESMNYFILDGLDANVLLTSLDQLLETDEKGFIRKLYPDYTRQKLQDLRDVLFVNHQHPD